MLCPIIKRTAHFSFIFSGQTTMTSNWMQGFTRRSFDLPDSTAVARVGGNPAGPVLVRCCTAFRRRM